MLEYERRYYQENKESVRQQRRVYRSNPKYRLNDNMSNRIHSVICKPSRKFHWEDVVGYSVEELKLHLESQFEDGMTWGNYGEWHIDHIIPVSAFSFDDPSNIDFKRCWSIENLRPLWAKENLSKGSKTEKHFQPYLKLRVG